MRSNRERIASPEEAARLIEAVPERDRALWATAMYGGLRRGELMALRWQDVDLAAGVIRVQRGWDTREGPIETKGKERRIVPIAGVLRDRLVEHRMATGEPAAVALVFGTGSRPFGPTGVRKRADEAWETAKLHRITLHESRHTFASLMIAAGVNAKALSTYMGHSSIQVTYDKYGHLMPGNEEEAAGLLDAFLERANTRARLAPLERTGAPKTGWWLVAQQRYLVMHADRPTLEGTIASRLRGAGIDLVSARDFQGVPDSDRVLSLVADDERSAMQKVIEALNAEESDFTGLRASAWTASGPVRGSTGASTGAERPGTAP